MAGQQEAEAARSYRMIGSSASVLVEYERARRWLREGIAFSARVELWNHHHYMAAHLAHVQWATGDWSAARVTAEHALADGRGGITTRITALYVLGYLRLGEPEAEPLLAEALALGRSMAELQRISPPLWGLAENALLTGDLGRAVEPLERGIPAVGRGRRRRLPLPVPADWAARAAGGSTANRPQPGWRRSSPSCPGGRSRARCLR